MLGTLVWDFCLLELVSLNVGGLGNSSKRADTLNYLKSGNYTIYFLQDTHSTDR